jgi:hypothetical protein
MAYLDNYKKFLLSLPKTRTIFEYLINQKKMTCLRHDVDYDLDLAVDIAFLEYRYEYKSSFYLLPSANYFSLDNKFFTKIKKIQEMGHEIGIHFNGLAEFKSNKIDSIEERYKFITDIFKQNGINIHGLSCHGDQLCYKYNFSNHWAFSDNKKYYQNNVRYIAEGPQFFEYMKRNKFVTLNKKHIKNRKNIFKFFSISLRSIGLKYDAFHIKFSNYFSDSGGYWLASRKPLKSEIKNTSSQLLIHPEHWGSLEKTIIIVLKQNNKKLLTKIINKYDLNAEIILNNINELKFKEKVNKILFISIENIDHLPPAYLEKYLLTRKKLEYYKHSYFYKKLKKIISENTNLKLILPLDHISILKNHLSLVKNFRDHLLINNLKYILFNFSNVNISLISNNNHSHNIYKLVSSYKINKNKYTYLTIHMNVEKFFQNQLTLFFIFYGNHVIKKEYTIKNKQNYFSIEIPRDAISFDMNLFKNKKDYKYNIILTIYDIFLN